MIKKGKEPTSRNRFVFIFSLLLFSAGGWWLWHNQVWINNWKNEILQYVNNSDIVTLEIHFSPEKIFEAHQQELLENDKRTLKHTSLKYYPYLLLDVKYLDGQKTREGVLLWGLTDGEIVLNTEVWETTHGFKDCLDCQATRNDFRILNTLAKHPTPLTIVELQKELQLESEILHHWVEESKHKHLIVQKGAYLQLHFENPKLLVTPQTNIKHDLVSKPLGDALKMTKIYSRNQILKLIQAAFGNEYKVRSEQEVFLPVYSLEILNPDGSIQMTEWNALTGKRIVPNYLSKN